MIGLGRKDEYSSLHAFVLVTFVRGGGGWDQYKIPFGDVPPTWVPGMVAKSASWYMNSSLKM